MKKMMSTLLLLTLSTPLFAGETSAYTCELLKYSYRIGGSSNSVVKDFAEGEGVDVVNEGLRYYAQVFKSKSEGIDLKISFVGENYFEAMLSKDTQAATPGAYFSLVSPVNAFSLSLTPEMTRVSLVSYKVNCKQ